MPDETVERKKLNEWYGSKEGKSTERCKLGNCDRVFKSRSDNIYDFSINA
jgi:hypothetical protein